MIPKSIEITDLTHDGRGVGHQQGKACFVEGALPGESVSWSLSKSHRQYDEGMVKEIASASPDRVDPECQHFGICGGCQIQHLSYPAQVSAKQNRLKQALQHKDIVAENWLEPITAMPWNYRRRARLAVAVSAKRQPSNPEMTVGFMRRASNQILPVDNCPILVEELNQLLPHLPSLLASLSNQQRESVTEVELSYDSSHISIRLIADRKAPATVLLSPPAEFLACDIWLKSKGSDARLIYSNDEQSKEAQQAIPALKPAAPPGFMQANAEINAAMIDKVDQLLNLGDQDILLDLFCGSGNLSFSQARRAKEVIGIEVNQTAVAQAKSTAQLQSNISFRSADLFEADALKQLRSVFRKATAVLLDPPRAGAEALMHELVKPKPKQILYVSCHPATFVRDAQILVSKGYRLDSVGLLDMFPQTMHAEVIGHFLI